MVGKFTGQFNGVLITAAMAHSMSGAEGQVRA
jgi:hypothetical protein